MSSDDFLSVVHKRLIVSCQALEDEPLHGSETMGKMALAAKMGGAKAIRANSARDIEEIKKITALPIIGLVKKDYPASEVYITPTIKEVDELLEVRPEVIALDATIRERPGSHSLKELVQYIHGHKNTLVMGDIASLEDARYAEACGVDIISTTLSGYTHDSPKQEGPDFRLVEKLSKISNIPVFAEGRIQTPEQALEMLKVGAWAVVVGGAITRPQQITQKFVQKMQQFI